MPQLLLEIFSEEIPARMQGNAARELERMAREGLAEAGLTAESLTTYAGPRRLTLVAEGLPAATPDVAEERKGPRVGSPDQAIEGFLRSTGLTRADLVERDGVYFANIEKKGRPTPQIVAEMVEAIVRGLPWPKSMRWGTGSLRWIRPIQRILCVFDGEVVPFEIDGIASGDLTEGHRFMGSGEPFAARDFAAYAKGLEANRVVLDAAERKRRILDGARAACAAKGVELIEDEGLLDEVAGLAEWPTPLLGEMDASFLDLPAEVIRTSMRAHQKYFAVRDPKTGGLAPHFLAVANIEASDGGVEIAQGNARVLSARLNDARFFWDEDRKAGFDKWLEKLNGVTFHAKLGTTAERVERITALAREIAPLVGADPDVAAEAARLAKADLASGMVGEFPELQGIMGGYYARALAEQSEPLPLEGGGAGVGVRAPQSGRKAPMGAGAQSDLSGDQPANTPIPDPSPLEGEGRRFTAHEREQIADAIRHHYKPQGPNDAVPTAPVSVAVALADKLDTLVGFFAIDEKPTGSRDPYGLRRAALGMIRIILDNRCRTPVLQLGRLSYGEVAAQQMKQHLDGAAEQFQSELTHGKTSLRDMDVLLSNEYPDFRELIDLDQQFLISDEHEIRVATGRFRQALGDHVWRVEYRHTMSDLPPQVLAFLADRLKVLLRDQGKRHDLVDAVFALGDDDLVRVVARVDALEVFLSTDDGANLLAGYKRASNILKAEEKKDALPDLAVAPVRMDSATPQENVLIDALDAAEPKVEAALAEEDFAAAMTALAGLRAPVDAFFDKVLVNSDDAAERDNRLRILARVRAATDRVADFSKIGG